MLRIGGVCASYLALDEAHRVEVLSAELATARPLLGVDSVVTEVAESELTILRQAADVLRTFGPNAIENYIISKCESVSDVLESPCCSASRTAPPHRRVGHAHSARDRHRAPVRDHCRPAAGVRCGRRLVVAPPLQRMARPSWPPARGHARVLRQQQGRRLPLLELGAVSLPGRPRRSGSTSRREAAAVPRSRGHCRPRRRVELSRDHRSAGRQRAGRSADDRAGRDDLRQVRRPGARPPEPRSPGCRIDRVHRVADGRPITWNRDSSASPTSCRSHLRSPTASWCDGLRFRRLVSAIRRSSNCRR
jgi:hypothetical protein